MIATGSQDREGNIIDGDAIIVNCKNTMVHSRSGRLAGCIGLEDIIIIDTPDALLICHHGCTQDVRRCVELIKERGLDDLL
jgi:mannose-1-phosphate guanylyltransferase